MTRKTNEEWGRNRWRVVEADNKEQAWEKAKKKEDTLMKYKVIEHLTHVYSVVIEADNKEQAWEKAMEGGLMSESGILDDLYVNKFEVEEVSDE